MTQTSPIRVDVLRMRGKPSKAVTGRIKVWRGEECIYECCSLERTSRLITPGTYRLVWSRSPRFSRAATARAGKPTDVWTPEILGVPGRSGLRIHVANFAYQLEGCIAPGVVLKDIDADGTIDVAQSGQAYGELVACLLANGIEKHPCEIRIF